MVIVTKENYLSAFSYLEKTVTLAFDTETTGLRSFHGDRVFAIILGDDEQQFYFNFNHLNEGDRTNGVEILDRQFFMPLLKNLFSDPNRVWVGANVKFDCHMLSKEGIEIEGSLYDVLVLARLEHNDHLSYSLASCSARIGLEKSKEVDLWIKQNRAYEKVKIPGKDKEDKKPLFYKVPFEIISRYGCMDVEITYKLFIHQLRFFRNWSIKYPQYTSIWNLVILEMEVSKVCYNIEKRGILLDSAYVKEALFHELSEVEQAKSDFFKSTSKELVDSNKEMSEVFKDRNLETEKTKTGKDSFSQDCLEKSDDPLAKILLKYRDSKKRASSYYSTFLYHADENSIIHCNFRQGGTKTGRFSISDPALQTLSTDESEDQGVNVRRSFIPRDGYVFVSIDYKAFEFRAMLDTAGEEGLAKQIENGLDPHQATADLVGISRKEAKTLNFGLLFGMGAEKLANALGVDIQTGKNIKYKYFSKLPKIRDLIKKASNQASIKTFVVNRFGRPYMFLDAKFAYKAINALIQGGTADAVKSAMVRIHHFLKDKKSYMALQIHDELLFEVHKSEIHLIPGIVAIMESAWPQRFHKMECSVDWSDKSWGELKVYGPETRECIQKTSDGEAQNSSELGGVSTATDSTGGIPGLDHGGQQSLLGVGA